jgi:ethanolamine utilization protein EutQ (cupin superfamily)
MSQTQSPVQTWKASDIKYDRGGEKMPWVDVLGPDNPLDVGYFEIRDASAALDWTEKGDEIIWVLEGHVKIAHGADVHELVVGDVIYMHDAITLRMTGTAGSKIAYIGHIRNVVPLVDGKAPVSVWTSPEKNYIPIGEGMVFCNLIEPEDSQVHAGYLEGRGGTLRWTQAGDEIIWVVEGSVRIEHGGDTYDLGKGDIVFMKKGTSLVMHGSGNSKIAYVSHL